MGDAGGSDSSNIRPAIQQPVSQEMIILRLRHQTLRAD